TLPVQTMAFPGWESRTALPAAAYNLGAARVGCTLYAVGGLDVDDEVMAPVRRLDLTTETWSLGRGKPTPSASSGVAQVGGLIYAMGGIGAGPEYPFLAAVEVYDPATDSWRAAAPLPLALSSMGVTTTGGRVYSFGGRGDGGATNRGFSYDPAANRWQEIAPVPTAEFVAGGAVALGGSIYVLGGWPAQRELWRYDPAANHWSALKPMTSGRHGFVADTDGRYLYVAGGARDWSGLTLVERYDPQADTWATLPSLGPTLRAGAAGALVDGRLYMVGGAGGEVTSSVTSLDVSAPLGGSYLAAPRHAAPGDILPYTLMLRNSGEDATWAQWELTLPAELEFVLGSLTGGGAYDPASRRVIWSGSLAARGAAEVGFRARVGDAVARGAVITSTAYLRGEGCVTDRLQAVTAIEIPSLEASSKAVDQAVASPGDTLRYTVRVANASPYTLTGTLTDPIPTHTTYVGGSVQGASYSAARNRIEWQGSLPPAADEAPAFQWRDATGGTDLDLGDDACKGPLALGFPFTYYGSTYTSIYVNSNGMVLFSGCSTAYSNTSIPSPEEPNGFVAPFWDDLQPGTGEGKVYLALQGAAPTRMAVIQWNRVRPYADENP
ncbi:MAG: kelch repeat-containing protein, partial [Chloroflexota bacterium]